MVYDFAGKIKDIKNVGMLDAAQMEAALAAIHTKMNNPLEVKVLVADNVLRNSVLVKSQISISSLPGFLDVELNLAIDTFKSYLDDIAATFEGEVSKGEGFYNNSKTFSKLY